MFINEEFNSLDFGEEKRYLKDSIKLMSFEIYARRDEFPREIKEEEEGITEKTKGQNFWTRFISRLKG